MISILNVFNFDFFFQQYSLFLPVPFHKMTKYMISPYALTHKQLETKIWFVSNTVTTDALVLKNQPISVLHAMANDMVCTISCTGPVSFKRLPLYLTKMYLA